MQSLRALALAVAALLAAYPALALGAPELVIPDPARVESHSFEPGEDCSYRLVLELREDPVNVSVLLNGTVDITWLVLRRDGRTLIVYAPRAPPARLAPGAAHEILVNGELVALVECPRTAQEPGQNTTVSSTLPPGPATGRPGQPGEGDLRVPPPPVEGGDFDSAFKSRFHLAISASAGAATLLLVVVEHGRSREGRGGAEEREAGNDL